MNKKALSFIKNILYAVSANVSRILITFVLTLLLPKFLSIEQYSYWQLYLFYATYLTYSSIGWCEGTYLKYGGQDYKNVDKHALATQFLGLSIYEVIFGIIVLIIVLPRVDESEKVFVLVSAAIFMCFYIMRFQLQTVLQATGRISDYAKVYTLERVLFFILALICIIGRFGSYRLIVIAEVASNLFSLIYASILCKEAVFKKPLSFKLFSIEAKELIGIGYKLTLAGFASQLIIGIVRFAIEQKWGTIVFGKISLSFSMANMMITCIAAISIVLFPMLKHMDKDKMQEIYPAIRDTLTFPMFAVLLAYVPAEALLSLWIPQYADSLKYLAILFPLCIYEGRNSVLVWTYLKAIRQEKMIMRANLVTVAVSVVATWFTVYFLESLDLAVAAIVFLYALKGIYTEALLGKSMKIKVFKENVQECILTVIFIISSWRMPGGISFAIYLASYIIYLVIQRKNIKNTFKTMTSLLKQR